MARAELPALITAELPTSCHGVVFLGSHLLCVGVSCGSADVTCHYVRLIPPPSVGGKDWSWEVLYSPSVANVDSQACDLDYHSGRNLVRVIES